ncbi:MAG: rhamnulokinase [Bacteroidales bacterium]|nr:rhamnulokinase [Bacteroidales bacterium]
MEISNYLAVDLGATSGRTVLASFDGQKVKMTELTRFSNPMIPIGGHLYWDIAGLYNEILMGLKKVADEGIQLNSIGIDTWGCDFAFFGKDGQLLGLPHCYRDSHTEGAQQKFFERMSASEVYSRTGIQFMDFNSLFQMDTIKRNGGSALEAADKVLFIPDALIYMLTGKAICEYTVASTSQMLNPVTGDLDEDILNTLGIPRERFGKLTQPGTVVGQLTTQVQEFTGLPAIDVVTVAGHDTGSAVAAVPAENEEYAYLSCGTWSLLGIETPQAIITEESFHHNFTNEGGIEGTTRFLKNICGLWIFEQCRKEFKNAPEGVAELVALCETTDFSSLIDPDAACFSHPSSMSAAINDYCVRTGQAVPQSPAEYCRVIFRSLALRYRQVVEILESMAPFSIRKLHVIGGGSLNRHLMQYAANSLKMPVICGPVEGTALGNILMQIKSAGKVETLPQMRAISAASVELKTYMPENTSEWDKAYEQFIDIQNRYNNH